MSTFFDESVFSKLLDQVGAVSTMCRQAIADPEDAALLMDAFASVDRAHVRVALGLSE